MALSAGGAGRGGLLAFEPGNELLGFHGGLAALAGRRDGLAEVVVLGLAGHKHPLHIGVHVAVGDDVAVLVNFEFALEDFGVRVGGR